MTERTFDLVVLVECASYCWPWVYEEGIQEKSQDCRRAEEDE